MMNYIWAGLILVSVLTAFFYGNIQSVSTDLIKSIENAVMFTLKLLGMFCFWGGITKIAEESGVIRIISKLLSPVLNLIFKETKDNEKLKNSITMSVTANLLGIGNAATPLGIKAMSEFNKNSLSPQTATNDMILFVVMNTAALRIIPTTVAEIRNNFNAENPFDILPVTVITSLCSLSVGLILAKLIGGKK